MVGQVAKPGQRKFRQIPAANADEKVLGLEAFDVQSVTGEPLFIRDLGYDVHAGQHLERPVHGGQSDRILILGREPPDVVSRQILAEMPRKNTQDSLALRGDPTPGLLEPLVHLRELQCAPPLGQPVCE